MRERHVYVVGLDDFNLKKLQTLRHPNEWYVFHELVHYREVQHEGNYPFVESLTKAEQRLSELERNGRPVDGIIGYWDFPVTAIVAALGEQHAFSTPSLAATLKCEHKYWSRLEQQRVVPESTPRFAAVDPFSDVDVRHPELPFPFWIKPIKSFSSQLGFHVRNSRDYGRALRCIRRGIGRFAKPFNQVLQRTALPPEVRDIDGKHCILEQIVGGHQCTVEGYVFEGEPYVYGTIDSIRFEGTSSFARYQYPSSLPRRVQQEMAEESKRLMLALGYDNGTFNIEFFWDEETDHLWLLEVNPRLSQSHSTMFHYVDGISNLDKMVQIALGRRPEDTWEQGPFAIAAKCFHRKFQDAFVERVPTLAEVEQLERQLPGVHVQVVAQRGRRLSELQNQDSYSFELALLHIAANSEAELLDKLDIAVKKLNFRFTDERDIYAEVA